MNRHCDPVTMDHIIELRKRVALLEKQLENTLSWVTPLREKSAGEIERLREQAHYHYENGLKKNVEIERLREALRHMLRWHDQLSPADIAKAKAALKEGE